MHRGLIRLAAHRVLRHPARPAIARLGIANAQGCAIEALAHMQPLGTWLNGAWAGAANIARGRNRAELCRFNGPPGASGGRTVLTRSRRALRLLLVVAGWVGWGWPGLAAPGPVQRYDFQPTNGPVARGFTRVTPGDVYSAATGFGFIRPPASAVDGSRHAWQIFDRLVSVSQAIPASVLSEATVDCVIARGTNSFSFRADVPPGDYDVTIWLGNVTRPLFQIRATINGVPVDVERMDVVISRGRLDMTTLPDGATPGIGNAVPRTVRVSAPEGRIEVTVGMGPNGTNAIYWTYWLDESASQPPQQRTEVLVPGFIAAALQALTLHPAADPPLVAGPTEGTIALGATPTNAVLLQAIARFNAGDMDGARAAFQSLTDPAYRVTRAAGLFWVAGHPATIAGERDLLAETIALLEAELAVNPTNWAAEDLLLQARLADDAERYRTLYGYGGTPAAENLGRSCSLVEPFQPGHPYHLKGRILWLRNRGGLDPNRNTISWERAQWLARQLDPAWGGVNPFVRLYATDQWVNDGRLWTFTDWGALAGPGPDWARTLVRTLNAWLDLFEWWAIHRQTAEGDIGGGWTDDVEIVPAFALSAFVLEDASHLASHAALRFADGLWNSSVMDRARGYQAQYGDVEHTAEPSGYGLTIYPLLRPGDPEGLDRILKSAKTFTSLFLTNTPAGHTHFRGNHMSATQIALDPNHRADIPLNGRVTLPFNFLVSYSGNPGIEGPLRAWAEAWADDAARTDKGKPAGVFPNAVWAPTDEIGFPGNPTNWWGANSTYGQFSAFPDYHFHLYAPAAFFFLRTGQARFRAPFDALQSYALAWQAAGRPALGAAPVPGQESIWAGGKLASQSSLINIVSELARATGRSDWDELLGRFATSYARFLRAPTEANLLNDGMQAVADQLAAKWPYKTTEGVMTDRILLPGWGNVLSYYMGADWMTFFLGFPQHGATWQGTGRFFAVALHQSSTTNLAGTVYLFADAPREVTLKLWLLELGGEYVLEAGPTEALAHAPTTIAQTVGFTLTHRGQGVRFTVPGRTLYALRIRQTAPGTPTAPLRPDVGLAARDITYSAAQGGVTVRVHSLGSVTASNVVLRLHAGAGPQAPVLWETNLPPIPAPLDLVPRWLDVFVPFNPPQLPMELTAMLDPADTLLEVTEQNNTATAVIGGLAPEYPPPMLTGLVPTEVLAGGQVTVLGRNFRPGLIPLQAQSPAPYLSVAFVDESHAVLTVAPTAPDGIALVSVANPDGRQSNVLPLRVRVPARLTVPPQTGATIATEGFRFSLTGSLNQIYLIEHSPDLEHWQPLSTNQFLGAPVELLDRSATNASMRFYRARSLD